jgi:uncharacterized membrane protein
MAIIAPEEHRIGYYIFSLFCFSSAMACLVKGKSTEFFLSVIGTIILVTIIFCMIPAINNGSSSMFGAIMFSIIFGYPSLKAVLVLRFGLNKKKNEKENDKQLLNKENNE